MIRDSKDPFLTGLFPKNNKELPKGRGGMPIQVQKLAFDSVGNKFKVQNWMLDFDTLHIVVCGDTCMLHCGNVPENIH